MIYTKILIVGFFTTAESGNNLHFQSRAKAKYMVMNPLNKIIHWTIENVYFDYVILLECYWKYLLVEDIKRQKQD